MDLASATTARRQHLSEGASALAERYWQNHAVENLMGDLTDLVDSLVLDAWEQHLGDHTEVALFAVGGYGRRELHPGSDIDLLVLAAKPEKLRTPIEHFLRDVFDLNLEVGHSVRDVKGCLQQARGDITVATALLERRMMAGDLSLVSKLDQKITPDRIGTANDFFRAKYAEQTNRHDNYLDTDYNLEPNVKTSPGGLRDIHTALWICLRQFATTDTEELVALGVLSEVERRWLEDGRRFLWWVRFGLHLIVGRKEDQLRFVHQRELAQRLGFVDTDAKSGVELFMHHYYRHVLALTEVNDIIIQFFRERSDKPKRDNLEIINSDFALRNKHIETQGDEVFRNNPAALLEMFVIIAHREDVEGVSAATIRLIRESLHLIDDKFRNNPEHTQLFMRLLKAPFNIVTQLTRMRRYGVLARYIPEFAQIVGQMQHDLFHIYTVDAHTLQVVENMRKFRLPQAAEKFPVAAHIFNNLPKVELLYIAGLYHDIAKGRGGNHSELGKIDAVNFCERHQLSKWDTGLVSWLVDKHLLMSMTAQRKDTNDPAIIKEFAEQMGDKLHLDYLYAMTVADICATNPELWNSWRATLLRQLYTNTKKAFQLGLEKPINRQERIADKQQSARAKLLERGLGANQIEIVWTKADDEYFVRESSANIIWHTEGIANFENENKSEERPLILVQDMEENVEGEGATQVFIYANNADFLFANSTAAFEKLNLNIYGARVFTSANDHCMDTFTVLENTGLPVGKNPKRQDEIRKVLTEHLTSGNEAIKPISFRRTRKEKYFAKSIEVTFVNTSEKKYSSITRKKFPIHLKL